jgi:hypothetical protein
MEFVRKPHATAWGLSGPQFLSLARALIMPFGTVVPGADGSPGRTCGQPGIQMVPAPRISSLGVAMNDFWVIFTTVVVFVLFFLLVKGVERIER